MAETLFVADESDVRGSIANINATLHVLFLQQRRWDTPSVSGSANLSEYPELCQNGLTFFVVRSAADIKLKEVKSPGGRSLWEFDYRGTTGWIMLEAGGPWVRSGDKRWVPGRVRANLSDEHERELYSAFKKLWLKGYKVGREKIKFGPSALKTLSDEVLANW